MTKAMRRGSKVKGHPPTSSTMLPPAQPRPHIPASSPVTKFSQTQGVTGRVLSSKMRDPCQTSSPTPLTRRGRTLTGNAVVPYPPCARSNPR